jgi:plastocyanin
LTADETYQVSLEYCGSDPNPVIQVFFLGQTITLTDVDGDGVYIGEISQFSGNMLSAQGQVVASAPLTISVTSGNVETVLGGTIESASEGVVYDIQSGQALSAAITLLQAIDGDSEAGFDLWPGADYGQANPQTNSNTGEYAFWPEADIYHLTVSRDAYQVYRSWNVRTTGEPVNPDLPLTPEITAAPDYIIEIGPDGFEPSLLTVPPGSIVKWVNADIGDHTSTSTSPALVGPGTPGNGGWDSGRLSSGESYMLEFAVKGTFAYADRANPSHTAQIKVGDHLVYLPMITR